MKNIKILIIPICILLASCNQTFYKHYNPYISLGQDIEMIKKADFGVSFNGKKILDLEANIHFKNTNLKGLLYAQGYSDKEII